eukprot:11782590-Prorocentrum_lima.AAC.1
MPSGNPSGKFTFGGAQYLRVANCLFWACDPRKTHLHQLTSTSHATQDIHAGSARHGNQH